MFEHFLEAYGPGYSASDSVMWAEPNLLAATGYAELASQTAGKVFGGGLLRIHTDRDGPLARGLIQEAFPEFAARAVPFAQDWLGREFAVDRERRTDSELQILLLEPGSGEVFDIDEGFRDFFDVDLVQDADTFLASDFFNEWRSSGGEIPNAGQCVGFKVPLFLGGAGSIDNLEITDLEVYWSLCGQMRAALGGMTPGTQIDDIEIS